MGKENKKSIINIKPIVFEKRNSKKVGSNINGYKFEKKPNKFDFSKENIAYKKEILSEKFGKKRFYRKQKQRIEKIKYRSERMERGSLRLSKSMIIVFALIFFTISSYLLNTRVETKNTTVSDKYSYEYSSIHIDDVENIGNLLIDTPRKIVNIVSNFTNSISSLFKIGDGGIFLLDVFSTLSTRLSYDIEKVIDFLSGNVFEPIYNFFNRILKWINDIFGSFPGWEDFGGGSAPGGGGGGSW